MSGELDAHDASRFRQAIAGATRRSPDQLVVDLSRVTFMDSAALHVVVAEQWLGDRLHLVAREPRIRRLLRITG